jgi:hypothetical protein
MLLLALNLELSASGALRVKAVSIHCWELQRSCLYQHHSRLRLRLRLLCHLRSSPSLLSPLLPPPPPLQPFAAFASANFTIVAAAAVFSGISASAACHSAILHRIVLCWTKKISKHCVHDTLAACCRALVHGFYPVFPESTKRALKVECLKNLKVYWWLY